MSQVVDLGYVVGPTGPKGSDATLPETEKIRVYVAAFTFRNTEKLYVKYVSNHSVVTKELPVIDEDNKEDPAEYTMYIECDFGSVVYFTSNVDNSYLMLSCYELYLYDGVYYLNYVDDVLVGCSRYSSQVALVPYDNLYACVGPRKM